jgi:hypothetical protein
MTIWSEQHTSWMAASSSQIEHQNSMACLATSSSSFWTALCVSWKIVSCSSKKAEFSVNCVTIRISTDYCWHTNKKPTIYGGSLS